MSLEDPIESDASERVFYVIYAMERTERMKRQYKNQRFPEWGQSRKGVSQESFVSSFC